MFKPIPPSFYYQADHPRRRIFRFALFGIVLLVLASVSIESLAQSSGFAVLDPIRDKYAQFQNTWYTKIRGSAERLFWMLVSIDFAWTGVIYVLDKNDIGEIAISTVKKILTVGFFYSLLKFSDTWIPAIISSFTQIGTTAGGVAAASPDGIAATGYELATACFGAIKKLGMLDALAVVFPVTLVALIILMSFLFVAAQLLVTLVESYLAIGAGVILLGFGGSRWTTDFATKYLQYAVGTGIKLMLLYLVVGVGQTLTAQLTIDSSQLIQSCLQVMGAALVYGYLAIQIPSMASAMMSGSPSMTAGALASSALTLGAAAAGAGAAAAGAGKAASGGAGSAVAGAAGLSQALGAGLNSAADLGLKGVGGAMHATGEVMGHAMGMAASGIGDAVAGGGKSFGEKVADSTGGRIASQIEAGRGGSLQEVGAQTSGPASSASGSSGPSAGGSGSSNAGSGASAPSASSSKAGAAPATTGTQAGGDGVPGGATNGGEMPSATSSGLGDASNVEVGPSNTDSNRDGGRGSGDGGAKDSRDPLHNRIQDLQGFVPSDAGHAAGIQIDLKHTQD